MLSVYLFSPPPYDFFQLLFLTLLLLVQQRQKLQQRLQFRMFLYSKTNLSCLYSSQVSAICDFQCCFEATTTFCLKLIKIFLHLWLFFYMHKGTFEIRSSNIWQCLCRQMYINWSHLVKNMSLLQYFTNHKTFSLNVTIVCFCF